MLYDKQRLAVMDEVNRNNYEFQKRNYEVTKATLNENAQRDRFRRDTEHEARMEDQQRDKDELAWTNATKLHYSENQSYSDKYLK